MLLLSDNSYRPERLDLQGFYVSKRKQAEEAKN